METFKNILIMFGAIFIPLATIGVGLGWYYAEGSPALVGQTLLLLLAVVFALKRNFAAMGLYLAGILFLMVVYPKLEDFESYAREGRMAGQFSELRSRLAGIKTADGSYPGTITQVPPPLKLRSGHKNTSAIDTVRLPDEAYLYPPQIPAGEKLRVTLRQEGTNREQSYTWSGDNKQPLLLYPGGTYFYEIRRESPAALVSSGTVKVPVPPDFNVDSGKYAYDRTHGHFFINCTHTGKQQRAPWWER
ncbi:MAG: hypothetical protein Q7R35_02455 [Elusimicrobiota bacterium]|nr:hypothetical protein [Elusimicrobiota bacterium]